MKDRPAVIEALGANEERHHEAIMRLYDLWHRWNIAFFDGIFEEENTPVIVIEPLFTLSDGYEGFYDRIGGRADDSDDVPSEYPVIRLCENVLAGEDHPLWKEGHEYSEGRFRYVADLMLHEMVHAFCEICWGASAGNIDWYEVSKRDSDRKFAFLESIGLVLRSRNKVCMRTA
ncbi:hypothetical protein [Desulfomonile tiedjei]|uniref:Uncharacterized protein n=1 Tax=Desulfomonile tiedjei (strain ATCC 49306 / DSM 6799 / DCB-1) TaxID=706587 RepID=I4C939_DESTA|nr:hypothetical protein [Desulfomonile tiedjei]AFM26080.1 hypothetical protein Desti_3428 [Desulfomonile tiedjei DSM 6799]